MLRFAGQLHPTAGRMVVLAPVGSWIVPETRPETGRAVAYCRVSSAGGGATPTSSPGNLPYLPSQSSAARSPPP